MKYLLLVLLLWASSGWADGIKISDLQLGYSYPSTQVGVLNYTQKLKFNQYVFKMNFSHSSTDDYFLGVETNLFRNNSSLSYEQFLVVLGRKIPLQENLSFVGEIKLGWGLMSDHGNLYKTEGYSGLVVGLSGGVRYQLNPSWGVGTSLNYLRQVHGQGLTNNKNSSQSYLFQSLAPVFLIIYNF